MRFNWQLHSRVKRHDASRTSMCSLPWPVVRVAANINVLDLERFRFGWRGFGDGEIRTHGPRKGSLVFKTSALNRSATSPQRDTYRLLTVPLYSMRKWLFSLAALLRIPKFSRLVPSTARPHLHSSKIISQSRVHGRAGADRRPKPDSALGRGGKQAAGKHLSGPRTRNDSGEGTERALATPEANAVIRGHLLIGECDSRFPHSPQRQRLLMSVRGGHRGFRYVYTEPTTRQRCDDRRPTG